MDSQFELRAVLITLRRWTWLIVACALLAGGAAYYVTTHMALEYQATTTLLVEPANSASGSFYNSLLAGERLALTYSQMLKSQSVIEKVIHKLGLPINPDSLAAKVEATPVRDTQLIQLSVVYDSPGQAAEIANTIAEVFTEQPSAFDAQRGAQSISNQQSELGRVAAQIEATYTQIDQLGNRQVATQAERSRLENLLAAKQDDVLVRNQEYQNLASQAALIADSISVLQSDTLPAGVFGSPYTATAVLLVEPLVLSGQNVSGVGMVTAQQALAYADLAVSHALLDDITAKTGIAMTPDELATQLFITPLADANAVRISVVNRSPERAQVLANAVAVSLSDQVRALLASPYQKRVAVLTAESAKAAADLDDYQAQIAALNRTASETSLALDQANRRLGEYRSQEQAIKDDLAQLRQAALNATDTIAIAEPAYVPVKPLRSPVTYSLLAALAGILLAVVMAFVIEFMDRSLPGFERAGHRYSS